jgi:5-deoxy-glucuronate isomerase
VAARVRAVPFRRVVVLLGIDGPVRVLLEPGPGARLGVARASQPVAGRTDDSVAWIVTSGTGTLRLGDATHELHGRRSVFDGPGWSAIVGPQTDFATEGELGVTIVWRATDGRPTPSRLIDPSAVPDEHRGERTTARRVRTYVSEGELIVGETINPPGGWSSWPPHSHEHEEIYLYDFDPPHGFGVHIDMGADAAEREAAASPRVVRAGDVVRITTGEHPVVAAPGCTMAYLWALAGDADTATTRFNPRFGG